ncbi:MATE family efflux transporter [Halomonas pacifica]|uniref:MATE family efflux transporter n=1 Tax=Bisbaumannia pacifica TaxID=77098 RepID=A0A510XDC0_9GAMM|nr:MATE family efflux transporter [Halomonas pacifica]MDC8803245.1 MATE family efflux transporter [Halomonas pacifica]GEK49051.1 MATE family efflux transporter [Halomonas pacifica]
MDDAAPRHPDPILSGPHWPVFWRYALPSVAGLLALTTANIVDGIFIGNFAGADALAALNLLIPYFAVLFGLALALAIGGTVRAGKALGEGDPAAASATFSKCLIATLGLALAAALLCLRFHEPLYRLLGAAPELYPLMSEYFLIMLWVLVVQLVTLVLYYFVRVDGFPGLATAALVAGAGANILLDALLVGYLGQGLGGAALATGLAQALQLAVLLGYFARRGRRLRFSPRQRHWGEVLKAGANGVSEWINEASVGLVMLLINWLLMNSQGVTGVAAFTVVNYLIFLSLMVFYGISDAMHVLVSHNLGAGNARRIRTFMGCGAGVILSLGLVLVAAVWWQGGALVRLFLDGADLATARLADQFLAILWPLFLINGLNVLLSVYLTAMHRPLPSAVVALSRSLVLPAALLVLIATLRPEWPLLLALPLAEWLTFGLALSLFLRFRPRRLLPGEPAGV